MTNHFIFAIMHTKETLKPLLVRLMFEHMRYCWVCFTLGRFGDENDKIWPEIREIVEAIVGVDFGDDFEICTERLGAILEEFEDYFNGQGGQFYQLDNTEDGCKFKKLLEEYVDWLYEIREKQQAPSKT